MNRVKVIKRSEVEQPQPEPKTKESDLRRQGREVSRRTANVVANWISEWREQKEKIAGDAVREFLHPARAV